MWKRRQTSRHPSGSKGDSWSLGWGSLRAGGHTRAHRRSRRRSTMPPSLLPPNRTSSAMLPSVKRTFRRNGGGEREHGAQCARARVAAGTAPAALRRRDRPGRWVEGPKGCDERAQLPEGRPRGWGRMHGDGPCDRPLSASASDTGCKTLTYLQRVEENPTKNGGEKTQAQRINSG